MRIFGALQHFMSSTLSNLCSSSIVALCFSLNQRWIRAHTHASVHCCGCFLHLFCTYSQGDAGDFYTVATASSNRDDVIPQKAYNRRIQGNTAISPRAQTAVQHVSPWFFFYWYHYIEIMKSYLKLNWEKMRKGTRGKVHTWITSLLKCRRREGLINLASKLW